MLLTEEYYRRYNLQCPFLVRPDKKGYSVAFTAKKNSIVHNDKWFVLTLKKESVKQGPAQYSIRWLKPSYNGGSAMEMVSGSVLVSWDEFEENVIRLSKNLEGLEPIVDLDELSLVKWQMFLYSNDELISSLPIVIQKRFWTILDPNTPKESFAKLIKDCCDSLTKHKGAKSLFPRWEQMNSQFEDYARWLGELFKKVQTEPDFVALCNNLA